MNSTASSFYRFGLLLVPGFSQLAAALVTEPLFIANWLAGRPLFGWTTLSADGFAVPPSSGGLVAVNAPLTSEVPFDTVLVIASFDPRSPASDPRIVQWLRRASRAGVRIGAVETGGEILATAGLLTEQDTPIHWYNAKGSQERHPDLRVTETLFGLADGRPLSAGGTATLDMMLDLIARLAGEDLAAEVGKHLLVEGRRPGSRPQPSVGGVLAPAGFGPPQYDAVARVHAMMEENLEEPVPCVELARAAGLSIRHLQRLFRARLGRGMEATYRELRLAKAHQLVQQTEVSLTEISLACGFSSLEVFSRAYRSRFGVAPSRDRRQSIESSVYHSVALSRG
jgi:AraC family carnitine catabolism transcriptional activator